MNIVRVRVNEIYIFVNEHNDMRLTYKYGAVSITACESVPRSKILRSKLTLLQVKFITQKRSNTIYVILSFLCNLILIFFFPSLSSGFSSIPPFDLYFPFLSSFFFLTLSFSFISLDFFPLSLFPYYLLHFPSLSSFLLVLSSKRK